MRQRILVWDFPTRLFHWLLVASFAGAFLTAESERLRDVHVTCGYLLLGLIGFRLVWGFVGSRHARFANFIAGPSRVMQYLRSLLQDKPEHYAGHNPAGAVAIILLIVLGLSTAVTGWLNFNEIGGEVFEELHEGLANGMLAMVAIHVLGVIVSSWRHRENLIGAMITGYKTGEARDGISRAHGVIALLLLTAVLGLGWALSQGRLPGLYDPGTTSAASVESTSKAARVHEGRHRENSQD